MKDEMGVSVTIAIFGIAISPAPTTYSSFILPPSSFQYVRFKPIGRGRRKDEL